MRKVSRSLVDRSAQCASSMIRASGPLAASRSNRVEHLLEQPGPRLALIGLVLVAGGLAELGQQPGQLPAALAG